MSAFITNVAGVDIGKDGLDVALHETGEALHVANTAQGCADLADWLARRGVTRVGLEASGGYERQLCETLRGAGLDVALLQPRQVRAYAIYRLRLAKNDRIDARLIAEVTANLEVIRDAPDPRLASLAEPLRLIEQIEADLSRMKTRIEAYREKRLQRWVAAEIARLERRLKAELLLLVASIGRHDDLARKLALIESVDGIGRRTAISLLILIPELGRLDRGQVASLAGLAPFDHDSGRHHGQRRIKGGRPRVRRALYAAALPASFRWNTSLVALYQRLRANGKNHKQALVACARKLLIFANTVVARQQPWLKNQPPLSNGC